jgi:hypothetical protein
MRVTLLSIAVAACSFTLQSAPAGEWLGGQYWGQISGCGHCGGSLYGLGSCCYSGCDAYDAGGYEVLPMPLPAAPYDAGNVEEISEPDIGPLPVIPTAFSPADRDTSSRRTNQSILPIAPANSASAVKIMTHVSRPERLTPPQNRIVAPNAWNAPLYR